MRIFVAGGSGVLGRAVIPLLAGQGHEITATSRSSSKAGLLRGLGATAVPLDAFDREATIAAVAGARPDAVLHLMTDLGTGDSASNARLRTLGTRNLVDAARASGVSRFVGQSIAWVYPPAADLATETDPLDLDAAEPRRTTVAAVAELEGAVRELAGGVVLRCGQLYGPETWYSRDGRYGHAARDGELVATETVTSFVHVSDVAQAVVLALGWEGGVWNIVDDEPAAGVEWATGFARALGAPAPRRSTSGDVGRPVSNARATRGGLSLAHPSWRDGFTTL